MPVQVTCPYCRRRLGGPDSAAGKAVKCPHCKHTFRVPPPHVEPVSHYPGPDVFD